MTEALKALLDRLITEEKAHFGSMLNKARAEDLPVLERNLRRLAEVELLTRTVAGDVERARFQQETSTIVHTLELITVRYEIIAAHEVRRILMRLSEMVIDGLMVIVDTAFPPLPAPGTS